ncbi:MAG: hypothetical protein J5748_02090 [Bacteroidales bacterium]|nr:hypothetical protein [Bacteroidales bacterium]
MKTVYKIALLLAGALLFGCNPEPADPENPDTPVKPEPEPAVSMSLTFVLPVDSLAMGKEAWVAGDKIVVHGEYANEQVEVTLASGDIDASGKKATVTVDGLHPYKSSERSSTLYAAYPASAVNNPSHCFCYSGFKFENTPMMAAFNEENTFNFVSISSAIRFTVSGDFDSYSFTSKKGATFGYDYYQVKLADDEINLKQYVQNARTGITGSVHNDGVTENYIFIAGEMSLPDGFAISFTKDGATKKTLSSSQAISVRVGHSHDLGNITGLLKDPVDTDHATPLDTESSANCYIITEPGLYRFSAVKGNDRTEVLSGVDSLALLWETWNTTDSVIAHSVIKDLAYDPDADMVIVKTPDELHPGNALIGAIDGKGKVLWSWHIWIPATEIELVDAGFAASAPIMDRNLGAIIPASTEKDTVSALGMYYQFGRKDPLCGTKIKGCPSDALKKYVAGKAPTYAESIQNPTVFYYVESDNWTSETINNLWDEGGAKTKYDPCPPGYRIPAFDKSRALWNKAGTGLTINMEKHYFMISPGTTVLTMGGYLNGNNQSESGYGERGYVLTSTSKDDTHAGCVLIRDNKFSYDSYYKSCGGNIRCMKEE